MGISGITITLEMGSWLWVKKNPKQLFSFLGIFNPMIPHRKQRVLRQNLTFFDFLIHAAISYKNWLPRKRDRQFYEQMALQKWYWQLSNRS